MAITSYNAIAVGNLTTVTVVSDLGGTVYYHWYLDGVWHARTTEPSYDFFLDEGDQGHVEVVDTADADFDYVAGAPAGYPARKTLWWIRSDVPVGPDAGDVEHYRIDQRADYGDWETIQRIYPGPSQWDFRYVTGRLDDLTYYGWQIVPIDAAGNEGEALEFDDERVVRTPDAPDYTITFDSGTTRVTFAAAA